MNKQLLALALLTATAAVIAFYPALDSAAGSAARAMPPGALPTQGPRRPDWPAGTQQGPRIEVVFALDTTGSMGGLIAAAKEKIWSIASTMASGQPAPEIRMGLVAYRDRGDAYVTQVVDLSDDLDSMYAQLMDFRADGGGDGPEAVNQALADAVEHISWSAEPNTLRIVFLVGDAPPHMDYQGELQYPEIIKRAQARGIVINTVQCGGDRQTQADWQRIAALAQGEYFDVAQDGNAVAVSTPFDEQLAELAAELDATRLSFGSAAEQARFARKQDAGAKLRAEASSATQARRAAFNVSASGAANRLGEQELVNAVTTGRIELEALAPAALPAELKSMTPSARADAVKERAGKRSKIERRIDALAKERDAYIDEKISAAGGAEDSLDHKFLGALRRQGAGVGLSYDSPPKY